MFSEYSLNIANSASLRLVNFHWK